MTREQIKAAQQALASYYSGSASASVARSVARGEARTLDAASGRVLPVDAATRKAARALADGLSRGDV